ncbi:alpha/beta hydrolase [Dokdonia pacifica]|uniref:Pimeloyl-ACP methyl ester carboxylesterase n=1 Tax=Dokdonia pacifica TaxID=1627892 RepID=A0A239DVI0_9FLAO|nr:alpha/beta hydrolase [Dokdonia pacifica]GGG41277.1 alpha/beta hydrolase [Dokdonia pacifica]SNS36327.1 Pimeloyl-ACP methyl ester carboxylesterase [Dokdonia pacifica]
MKNCSIYSFILCLFIFTTVIAQEKFSSFDGTTIAYVDEGEGTPIVLIHGFINDASSWNGTVIKKQLLDLGYRVIIPDLRGNGLSEKPTDEKSFQDNAEIKDLKALLNHLHIESTIALGYSRGAIVLAKWLTEDPRISKAIIGGMGLDFSNPDWDKRIIFERAFLGLDPLNEMTEGAVTYAKSKNADLKILGWSQRYQPVTSKKELSEIKIPTLIIAGDQDTDNGNPKELAELIPNATLIIIPGDHNTTYRKEPFATAVMRFLKK